MTTYACPEGHQSGDPEWCDTCGAPIGAPLDTAPLSAVNAPASPTAPPGPTITCTNCGTLNAADALFCESCGFDFTTGQAPPSPRPPAVSAVPDPAIADEPTDFAVEVSVDPGWYALQGADSNEPCPAPTTVRLPIRGTAVLIGRASVEKGLHPEVALNDDPGVSRRHAQLVASADGAWSAVDQGSMNGTYIVAGGALPDTALPDTAPAPIPVGDPVAIAPGDAVYVGAWSRIVLIDQRPAASPTG